MKPSDQQEQERAALVVYCSSVGTKLGWGDSSKWRDHDFESLSQKIFDATDVSLSVTTLKRLFGKIRYESMPNVTTLNALALFLGYNSWLEFKVASGAMLSENIDQTKSELHEGPERILMESAIPNESDVQPIQRRHGNPELRTGLNIIHPAKRVSRWIQWSLILVFGAIIILSFVLIRNGHSSLTNSSEVTFTSSPVTTGIPNTVVFHFNIADLKPQRVEIQQSWDETKRFDVALDAHEATSTYYYPGYFRAKLLLDGEIIREHDLFIPSDGWLATLYTEPLPRYFLKDEMSQDNVLAVEEDVIDAVQKQQSTPKDLGFHFVKDFGNLSADDFTLEASFRNTYAKGDAICQVTRIVILGTEGFAIIPFSIPGCVGDLRIVFHGMIQEGKTHDLSAFGCDFSQWQKFSCTIADHHAQIYLNDQLIHTLNYNEDIGRFAGMRFLFSGSGSVDDVLVKDDEGRVVFEDEF